MDHRDRRLRQFVQRLAEAHRDDRRGIVLLRSLARQAVQPVDVGAGLEMLPGAADHQRAHRRIVRQISPARRSSRAAGPRRRRSPTSGRFSVSVATPRSSVASRNRSSLMLRQPSLGSALAPHTSTPTRAPCGRRERAAQQRRKCRRAARLGDQAQPVPDQPLRLQRWLRRAPARPRRHAPGRSGTSGRRPGARQDCPPPARRPAPRPDCPARSALCSVGTALRLDADHLRAAGVPGGDAADQPAAAGCHQHMRQLRRVLFEFPSDGALARPARPDDHRHAPPARRSPPGGRATRPAHRHRSRRSAPRARRSLRCAPPSSPASAPERRSPRSAPSARAA